MNKRILISSIALLIIVVVAIGYAMRTASVTSAPSSSERTPEEPRAMTRTPEKKDALEKAVQNLKLNQLEQRVSALEVNDDTQDSNRVRAVRVDGERAVSKKRMTSAEKVEQRRLTFETAFEEELPDRDWAKETESEIRSAAQNDRFSGSEVLDVTCKSTVCRMTVSHEDEASLHAFVEQFDFYAPPTQESWHDTTGNEHDGFTTTYYSVKKGHYITASPPPPPSERRLVIPSGFESGAQ